MTLEEILKRKLERVKAKDFGPDSYLKVDYAPDGEPSPWAYLVSERSIGLLGVAPQRFLLEEAFGDLDTWEEYTGKIFRDF